MRIRVVLDKLRPKKIISLNPSLPNFFRLFAGALLFGAAFRLAAAPVPLIHAHAHNDYEHQSPLFDALDHGFCSVEADIYLVEGKLLVAHNRADVKPERTLQALYLDPLRGRVKQNGGRVFKNGPEFTLLIDMKSDWHTMYPVLCAMLTNYDGIFSTFRDDKKQTNAITVIISGNRSHEMFAGEITRRAAFDGGLTDLDSAASPNFIPWISSNWSSTFKWRGDGAMPADEKQKLQDIVTKAHARGRKVRFWGAPDSSTFWKFLLANEVDVINTDDLDGLQKIFREHEAVPSR